MPYLHGTYGEIVASKVQQTSQSDVVLAYIGTAPVNLIRGYADMDLVNMPIKLANMGDVQNKVGYSTDWKGFTLCEAFAEHFDNTVGNVGPIFVVNVLDPAVHRKAAATTKSLTFSNGRAEFESDKIILDTFAIADKVEGTDYSLAYNYAKGAVVVTLLDGTATATLTASYAEVDPDAVTYADIIGSQSADGIYTGTFALKLLYHYQNAVLDLLAAPGWSHIPAVYNALVSIAKKLNGHWEAFVLADIPIEDEKAVEATVTDHEATVADSKLLLDTVEVYNGTTKGALTTDYTVGYANGTLTVTLVSGGALYSATKLSIKYKAAVQTLADAEQWRIDHGYTAESSKAMWPQVKDGSGRVFHVSSVWAATQLRVDLSHNGVPFETASNKEIMATAQFFGANSKNRGFDQDSANELNAKGITTAVFWAGRWVLWGPHTAAYTEGGSMDARAIFDVNLRMLMYITNSFQIDHGTETDGPMSPQDRDTILNAERARLDSLKSQGALIGDPTVEFIESENPISQMMNGDFVWDFEVTNTPPFKSGTARIKYTDEGFQAFYGNE
mgnify:CR=1 FL=1